MNDIWNVIAEMGSELHPERVSEVAVKIAALSSVDEFEKVKTSFGSSVDRKLIDSLHRLWKEDSELSPSELAASLRGASKTAALIEKREDVEMVWTGPTTGLVPCRHTEQVLLEVISSAQEKLFIVSFVAYNIETIMQALQQADMRKVEINVILELSQTHGGNVTTDSVSVFKKRIPTAFIYVWNQENRLQEKWTGSVHAKCAVADGEKAFITSANLTNAAMERNMELGVLISGGELPKNLDRHLEALITTRIVEKI